MRRSKLTLTVIPALIVTLGAAVGCGGGKKDDNNSGGTRSAARASASVTTVRGIRGAAVRLQALGNASPGSRLKTRTHETREYDPSYGLWQEFVQLSDTSFGYNYYETASSNTPVGSLTFSAPDANSTTITFDIPVGLEPTSGFLSITQTSATTYRITADFTDLALGERTTFDLTQQSDNSITGNMGFTDENGNSYAYRNMVISPTGRLTADVQEAGLAGRLVLNPDGSGQFTTNEDGGQYLCVWDANGAGYIQYPDGFQEPIGDFDTYDDDSFA